MATVIDALVVELGLDDSQFTPAQARSVKKLQDLEKAGGKVEKENKKFSTSTKDAAKSTEGFTRALTGLLAAIGGIVAIKSMIQDFIETNSQLDRLSKNLNVSVSDISAWSNATEKLGGSAAGLQGTLNMLSTEQTRIATFGESKLIPLFSAMGIGMFDASGHARSLFDILLDLQKGFSRMDRTRANNLGLMNGIDQGTMNLLLSNRKELELEIKRQKDHNVVTKAQGEEASRLKDKVVGLKQTFAAFGRELLMDAAPSVEKLLNILQKFGTWIEKNKEFVEDFLKVIAVGLGAIAIATLPIDLVTVAVIALAAAIALLWQDYQTWKRGGDALIPWDKWKPGIDAATAALSTLKDVIDAIFGDKSAANRWMNNFLAGLDAIGGKLKGIFGIDSKEGRAPIDVILGRNKPDDSGFQDTPMGRAARAARPQQQSSTGSDLADFVLSHEGIRKQVYKDVAGKDTIGIGHLVKPGEDFSKGITDAQAHDLLAQDLADARAAVDKYVKVSLTSHQRDALVDFTFASGAGSLQNSTLLKKLNAGDYAGAEAEFANWNHAQVGGKMVEVPQLTKIRTAEANLFRSPDSVGYAQALAGIPGAASMAASAPQAVGSSPSTVDRTSKTNIGTINVYTRATDAEGIADDISYQAWDFLTVGQANSGQN